MKCIFYFLLNTFLISILLAVAFPSSNPVKIADKMIYLLNKSLDESIEKIKENNKKYH